VLRRHLDRCRLPRTQAETNSTQRSVLHHGDGRVSHAGHAATGSDWPQSDTGVVFATRRTFFRRTVWPSVPPVTCGGCLAAPVEEWKIAAPASPSDFRPISITPLLSRSLERFVFREFFYPALLQPCLSLDIRDQFAFRPSGSTTAAIVAMLRTVRSMLTDNNFFLKSARNGLACDADKQTGPKMQALLKNFQVL